ncbi:MAG: glucosamine-6-phosphate deaminase [Candidatus Rifleibacteriota bacterium]
MEVIIKPDKELASLLAAHIVERIIKSNPTAVIGFATGSTPLLLYKELVRMNRTKEVSFRRVTSFNLDEYVGLAPDHPCSFHNEMEKNLFSEIDIPPQAVNIPDGQAKDIEAMCRNYEAEIQKAGGINLQILGIGHDGHLGFNEPGSSLSSRTRLKTLSRETLEANSRFFGHIDKVPRHVVTMGLGSIMDADICLLMAFGESKAEAVYQMIEGPVSASWPATILQHHRKAVIILDKGAAQKLKRKQYYLDVYAQKPEWQRW